MTPTRFEGKLAIQQRVLTPYRAAFFDTLAQGCEAGVVVAAGLPRPGESIAVTDILRIANYTYLHNLHLFNGPFYLCCQQGLLPWLKVGSPDALVVEANPRYLTSPAAVRWMKSRGKPVLGWGLGSPPVSGALSGLRTTRRKAFIRQFDALITYSRRGAEEYAALGFPSNKIFVAPNAAAKSPSTPMPSRPETFTKKPEILFVGRLQARKRLDLLLQACAALPAGLRPRLVIVGEGPERPALEALAKTVYPDTEFTGARHGEELAAIFTAADLFVLPGTGGLAVQEAMSYGLPVIMGQGDGTNDELVRPSNGWQILPDDLPALTETLRTALSDVTRLRRMGMESYRIVRNEINLEKMVGVFMEALQSIK
jgi:glycosyltransferase involved in cell wall biosynthesis